MIHQTNLAAINAARKQYGPSYREFVSIEKLALREWSIQLKQLPQASGIALETEREGRFEFPLSSISDEMHAARNSAAQAFFASLPKPSESQAESDAYEEWEAEQQAAADRIANAQASEQQLAKGKIYIRMSSALKPTKLVWHFADMLCAQAAEAGLPKPSRQAIQDYCIDHGIATGTARTQYQAWKKANDNAIANQEAALAASKRFNSQ